MSARGVGSFPKNVPPPRVSVVVATYQHAGFIEQCLNSILQQETDFPFEVLVGEDESVDGTREICQRFAAEYPDRIRLFLRSRKDVMHIMGRPTGRSNVLRLLESASGKYIAICEGDDHWIDPKKLQRQYDALENDPGASGCFTNAYNELNGARESFIGGAPGTVYGPVLTEAQFMVRQSIPTCTLFFRKEHISEFRRIVRPFATPDTALFTLLLGKGHLLYQAVFTAVRLTHPGGVYSMQGAVHHLRVQLMNLPQQDNLSGGRYSAILRKRWEYELRRAWQEAMQKEEWPLAQVAWRHLARNRGILGWSIGQSLLIGLKVHFPERYDRAFSLLRRVRRIFGESS
ncbi:MAG: glycosyltransferase [Flavobacteriales bacterium]|nr:glycosyltransferase [Flavobacteriales bacterium]